MKKKMIIASCFGIAILLLAQSFAPAPPPQNEYEELISNYDQQPPIAKHYWIQKLQDTLNDGSNIIMRIEYVDEGFEMPDTLNVFLDDRTSIVFRDDGFLSDLTAKDKIYSAFLKEDLTSLLSTIQNYQDHLDNQGTFLNFTGHLGEVFNSRSDIIHFDFTKFNNFQEVTLDAFLIDAVQCNSELKKQKSLFITDLSVVEDVIRTYQYTLTENPTNANNYIYSLQNGNWQGKWTFGQMVKNMANQNLTGISAKELLKRWIRRWTTNTTINQQTVNARNDVLKFLIIPWLKAAKMSKLFWYSPQTTPISFSSLTIEDLPGQHQLFWETVWDAVSEDEILRSAPFKLTAIVNRLDLMANRGYTGVVNNAGETRFIFTLYAPMNLYMFSDYTSVNSIAGHPPKQGGFETGNNSQDCSGDFSDWEGMNVIFEFGNPFDNRCAIKQFAQQWLDLSSNTLPLGSEAYNYALELITQQVTKANAAPNKPNGSALNQIRTNERIFFPTICGTGSPGAGQVAADWELSNWQLSQFELVGSPTGAYLEPVPVANTPYDANNMDNLGAPNGTMLFQSGSKTQQLKEWAFIKQNKGRLSTGNHQIPLVFNYNGQAMYRAAVAELVGEQAHYWDFEWTTSTYHYAVLPQGGNYPVEKNMRQQLSLNTCQGCHSGETKTLFTMVRPLGIRESANYWGTNPTVSNGSNGNNDFMVDAKSIDPRFSMNLWSSKANGPSLPQENNYKLLVSQFPNKLNKFYQTRVSAFLTGRNYSGNIGSGTWQDDKIENPGDDQTDPYFDNTNSLFFIYDPSNKYDNVDDTYPGPDRFNKGYNDLEMRKQFLCKFLNLSCDFHLNPVLDILQIIREQPLPLHGH